MAVILAWDDAADIGEVNEVRIVYSSGPDTYHVRSLRVVIDANPADYGSYPVGYPYTAAAALDGIGSNLGQGYDGAGDASQYSMETGAQVSGLSFLRWYWPNIPGTTITLHWDHAADIDVGDSHTSTGQVTVNGVNVGTFTTPAASVGWGSASVDISANWNVLGGAGADTSTADVIVNGTDVGDFTTLAASGGWQSRTQDITAQWLGSNDKVEIQYKSGADTYHVRKLRVEVDGGAGDYGEFPDNFPYTITAATGDAAHLGQAYDGAGSPRQWSMQTNAYVTGVTYLEWFFPSVVDNWNIGMVNIAGTVDGML